MSTQQEFVKQCKGKDFDKVTAPKLDDRYYYSIKYDGNYVQIHKKGDEIKFFTSGGKEFYLIDIADYLIEHNQGKDFIIEGEYIANTTGKMGNRGKCTCTTYRTLFNKGLPAYAKTAKIMAFDFISSLGNYVLRRTELELLDLGPNIQTVELMGILDLETIKSTMLPMYIRDGWEGLMLVSPNHIYNEGKRQNTSIKLKDRKTADLKCVDIIMGEGKYSGMIGSLVLVDKNRRVVSVGSGLNDYDRAKDPNEFIGKIVEIGYEQILDTYIQPTYRGVKL